MKGFLAYFQAHQGPVAKIMRSHFRRGIKHQPDYHTKTENNEKQYQSPSLFRLISQISRDMKRKNDEEFGEMESRLRVRFVLELQ